MSIIAPSGTSSERFLCSPSQIPDCAGHFTIAYSMTRMDDLAVQITRRDKITIDQSDGTKASPGQICSSRTSETSDPNYHDTGLLEYELTGTTNPR